MSLLRPKQTWQSPLKAGAADESAAHVSFSTVPRTRRIGAADLFAGGHEVEIVHGKSLYRLRRTSLGKLILTK